MRFSVLVILLSVALFGGTAFAESINAPMTVSVQVIARAVVSVESQPDEVVVTAADVARGYADVEAPIALRIRTNSRAGCLLQIESSGTTFSSIDLVFGDSTMTVSNHESWISRQYVAGGESISMKARVRVPATLRPGAYALALSITARPL